MDTLIFSSPIMWALVAFVSLAHVATAVPTVLGISKNTLTYAMIALDVLAHIALFAVALILGAKAEEIFIAVMMSAAVGMLTVFISEKLAAKRLDAESGEEDGDGI